MVRSNNGVEVPKKGLIEWINISHTMKFWIMTSLENDALGSTHYPLKQLKFQLG